MRAPKPPAPDPTEEQKAAFLNAWESALTAHGVWRLLRDQKHARQLGAATRYAVNLLLGKKEAGEQRISVLARELIMQRALPDRALITLLSTRWPRALP